MRSYRYLHLDVFTDHLFGGNQLAVFVDARGITPDVMQQIAFEMNFSETTFVLPADQPGSDLRVRIFTPGEELPMAGHPTVGTAFALAHTGVLASGRAAVTFGLGVGPTEVTLAWEGAALRSATMTQLPPTFGPAFTGRADVAASLGLIERDLMKNLPVQLVSCGVPYLLIPLDSRAAVDRARFDAQAWQRVREQASLAPTVCAYLFTVDAGSGSEVAYSRMFGAGVGISEDPATGSAAGPLGAYLVQHGLRSGAGAVGMIVRQGIAMGRPSEIQVSIESRGEAITRVRVGGTAVLAGDAILYLP